MRALVDLSLVHLVHPHVSPQMARQLRLVVAVLAAEFELRFLMLPRVTGEEEDGVIEWRTINGHRTVDKRPRRQISSVYRWLMQSAFVIMLALQI